MIRTLRWLTLGLASLLVLIVLPLYAYKVSHKLDYMDFDVYYRAAVRVKNGQWDQVYNFADGTSPFRYAPPLLPFFRPFAELTHAHARLVWYFLQFIWFGLGYFFIERTLRMTRLGHGRAGLHPAYATWITAASLLFTLRFCLDCFTIGQVSSLLFLGYCVSLCAWVAGLPGLAGAGLLVPSFFKIGPGFLYSLFASTRRRTEREHSLAGPLICFGLATAFLRLWVGSSERFSLLWHGWVQIVAGDSSYYDASHYGSQSIKSALLRAVNSGWLSPSGGQSIYLASVLLGCSAILAFWATRRTRTPLGRGLFFALGIFPYLWFMPETFKYSLTTLAIPIALLLSCPRKDRLTWGALIFTAMTVSIAGLDVVGNRVFFALQRASLPLFATFALAAAVIRQARRESFSIFTRSHGPLAPWNRVPETTELNCQLSLLIPLPLQSFSNIPASLLREILEETEAFFKKGALTFEILIAPYGDRVSELNPAFQEAQAFASQHESVQFVKSSSPSGQSARGAALREGFLQARGQVLGALNIEQPCELDFFTRAITSVESDQADWVLANRRHPESRFRIPVKYLPLVYGRHRLGLLFNRLVRAILPITTPDTHSGSWVMRREAATAVFALQQNSGFLFELEMDLTISSYGFRRMDLPVVLFLAQEKSPKRIGLEAWSILLGLPRLALRYRKGFYRPQTTSLQITADDWGITPGVNQGILELARLGIVRRVSIMAYGGYLQEGLTELCAIPGIELGLHFDLTYGKSTPARIMKKWMTAGRQRKELETEVRKEFETQVAILKAAGISPQYLDGHHHVQIVPGLIAAIAPMIHAAGIKRVRLPLDPALIFSKPPLVILSWLARASFRRHHFETHSCFYPQPRHFLDQGRFRAKLSQDPSAEVIVHPASRGDFVELQIPDPYNSERVIEYHALRMLAAGTLASRTLKPQ